MANRRAVAVVLAGILALGMTACTAPDTGGAEPSGTGSATPTETSKPTPTPTPSPTPTYPDVSVNLSGWMLEEYASGVSGTYEPGGDVCAVHDGIAVHTTADGTVATDMRTGRDVWSMPALSCEDGSLNNTVSFGNMQDGGTLYGIQLDDKNLVHLVAVDIATGDAEDAATYPELLDPLQIVQASDDALVFTGGQYDSLDDAAGPGTSVVFALEDGDLSWVTEIPGSAWCLPVRAIIVCDDPVGGYDVIDAADGSVIGAEPAGPGLQRIVWGTDGFIFAEHTAEEGAIGTTFDARGEETAKPAPFEVPEAPPTYTAQFPLAAYDQDHPVAAFSSDGEATLFHEPTQYLRPDGSELELEGFPALDAATPTGSAFVFTDHGAGAPPHLVRLDGTIVHTFAPGGISTIGGYLVQQTKDTFETVVLLPAD